MNKNILFFTVLSTFCFNTHFLSAMELPAEQSMPEFLRTDITWAEAFQTMMAVHNLTAFKKANPLPKPSTKYIPFMGNVYSMSITDPATGKVYVDHDAYNLYCARQKAANDPALQAEYYTTLANRLKELQKKQKYLDIFNI